ncbi:MAG: hypothetical protein V3S31_04800, partial [Dehalococcoidia bacterium]
FATLRLPAALVREVRLIEPEGLEDGWSADADGLRTAMPLSEARAGGERRLTVDVNFHPRVLRDGFSLAAQKGAVNGSRVRFLAIDGETARLVFEATLDGTQGVNGPLQFAVPAARLRQAFPQLVPQ